MPHPCGVSIHSIIRMNDFHPLNEAELEND